MNPTDLVDRASLRDDIPEFAPGDTLKVHVRVVEAVTRLVPGVMGNESSALDESFGPNGLLEHPQYTRPAEFRGWTVPEPLLSGDHARIERWRAAQSLRRTLDRRPDLLADRPVTPADQQLLEEFGLDHPPG